MKRGQLLWASAANGGATMWPEALLLAQQAQDFIEGPPVADIPAQKLSPHVWMIDSPDGFPTPENRGMMANVIFAVITPSSKPTATSYPFTHCPAPSKNSKVQKATCGVA